MTVTVLLPQGEKNFPGNSAESLLHLLRSRDVYIDAPCGGSGKCGKCKVRVTGAVSPVTAEERRLLTPLEITEGIRLACMCFPAGDCTVTPAAAAQYRVRLDGNGRSFVGDGGLPGRVGLAVDIGTTTVVAYFYDLSDGTLLYIGSGLNRQRVYGADVISRIEASKAENGKQLLKTAICDQLNGYIDAFARHTGCSLETVKKAVIAGNTVMLHFLCGLDAAGIAVAPFIPTSLFGNQISATELGLHLPAAQVYLADAVASYVGGDIVSGLLGCDADLLEGLTLFLDVGTNGEMALGDRDGYTCCATAAGPAFEGAHIQHGVGGVPGAINRVWLSGDELCFTTIGDQPSVGICGSGLIDAVACMLKAGIIDETGLLDPDELPDHYADRFTDGVFRLDLATGIGLTPKDIREVQLAKAAIAAGIDTLLDKTGYTASEVQRVFLAGGFGSYLNVESAVAIGLLPSEVSDRIQTVGNAAGTGAILAVLQPGDCARLKKLRESCRYFELSGDDYFQDAYVEHMLFPE